MKTILLVLILTDVKVVLKHELSQGDFSVSTDIYMLLSDLKLNIGKTAVYGNKILLRSIHLKIDLNRNINKAKAKLDLL